MSLKHETIDIRVSQRILWVGSEAYPLHNISRASTHTWEPRRGLAVWNYVKFVVLMLVLGIGVAAVLSATAGSSALGVLAIVVMLALIVLRTIRLVTLLKLTLHELIIETSGASSRAVVSDEENIVSELVFRITDAINNPEHEFHMKVENYHQTGDHINMFGNQNVGKVAR